MRKHSYILILAVVLMLAASTAFAQETFNIFGGGSKVTISSDEPYIIQNDKNGELEKLEFKKNVKAVSDDFDLFASDSLVYYKKDELVVAKGKRVKITQGKKTAENKIMVTCTKAEFKVNEGLTIFTGNPEIVQGEGNVSKGKTITIKQHDDGSSTMIVEPDKRATLTIQGDNKPDTSPPKLPEAPKEIKIDEPEKEDEM